MVEMTVTLMMMTIIRLMGIRMELTMDCTLRTPPISIQCLNAYCLNWICIFLYFIYDIGIEAESAFNEQHPSSLFILSGNIVQILKKCSPVLTADIATFYAHILAPYSLQIRYQYLNDTAKWRTVPMVKYSTDGIQNDYNFVGRVQFEEMFDRIQSTLTPIDHEEEDVDPDDLGVDDDDDLMATIPTKYDSDLTFEVMVSRHRGDGDYDDG